MAQESKNGMNIVWRNTNELIPYERNQKLHDETQIRNVANSIKRYGWKQPIVVDAKDVIIVGHCRLEAAKLLGLDKCPVVVADDLTEDEVREFRIADNKTNESPWDFEALAIDMRELSFDGFDFDFGDAFADMQGSDAEGAVDDDFDAEPPEEPTAKYGDVYLLGRHRLMCGDSTKLDDVKKLTDGQPVDLLITDPPYNVDYEGTAGKIQNDNMEDAQFREFLRNAFKTADEVMRPGAAFYIWHADSEGYNFRGACHDIGWTVRQCLIWEKNALVMGRQDYQWKHEPCLYGWKDGAAHTWESDRKQTTVLNFDKPLHNDLHPTMKPIPLFDYQIRNNTKAGERVLDLFGGSGTTIIACEQNNRNACVMELDPKFVDVIIQRWEQFTGQKAKKIK